jgi:hypothetical protein
MSERIEDIRSRLEAIADELADLALEALREAVDTGAQKRPESERALTRARTAVEKAVGLLSARAE